MTTPGSGVTSGAEVARAFYADAVRPIIHEHLAGVGYLAGRLGSGSDVIGYDDAVSVDHDFGCRLTLLVDDEAGQLITKVDAVLEDQLPESFEGRPVRFATTWDERVRHKVDLRTVHDFASSRLGFDVRGPLAPEAWLCLTGQSVLEVVGGPVFHDTTTSYARVVAALTWYPDDVWLYALAAGWQRLSQELPLVGRAGHRGDDLGSRVIAMRLTRDLIHLAFLLERRWAPYPKWLGTALSELSVGSPLGARLADVASSSDWRHRQVALGAGIEVLAEHQSAIGLPCPIPIIERFFEREYLSVNVAVVAALLQRVESGGLKTEPLIGSIEQWSDNVDLLSHPDRRARAAVLYAGQAGRRERTNVGSRFVERAGS